MSGLTVELAKTISTLIGQAIHTKFVHDDVALIKSNLEEIIVNAIKNNEASKKNDASSPSANSPTSDEVTKENGSAS